MHTPRNLPVCLLHVSSASIPEEDVSNIERDTRAGDLDGEQRDAQAPLGHGPAHPQHHTDEGAVGTLRVIHTHLEPQQAVEAATVVGGAAREGRVAHEARGGVHARQAVSRARQQFEQLRNTQHEVDYLRHEEQQQGLGEVAQDAHAGESHACEVAVGVAHKHVGGEPVVFQQSQAARNTAHTQDRHTDT